MMKRGVCAGAAALALMGGGQVALAAAQVTAGPVVREVVVPRGAAAPAPVVLADRQLPAKPAVWRALAVDGRVRYTEKRQYYAVRGDNAQEINNSMNRAGPRATRSKNSIGLYRSHDRIDYVMRQTGSACSLSSFTITHDVTIILPRWKGSSTATDETKQWWVETLRDVTQHEEEHAFIAAVEIRAMPDQLDRIPAQGSCDAMRGAVNRVSDRRWAAATHRNNTFDKWTQHGTTGPYWLG